MVMVKVGFRVRWVRVKTQFWIVVNARKGKLYLYRNTFFRLMDDNI